MLKSKFKKLITACVISAAMVVSMVPFDVSHACTGFRPGDTNNGVVNYNTPESSNEVRLKWEQKLGKGWESAPAVPTVGDDGYIYVASGEILYRLDKNTGKKLDPVKGLKLEDMVGGYGTNPMAYNNGKLYIHIGSGRIEAVDVSNPKELKHIWTSEKIGGQTISPIIYNDGYLYTGTWKGEKKSEKFFCLNAENGNMQWKYDNPNKRGYYWMGAYVDNTYAYFGSDDGELRKVNAKTGELIKSLKLEGEQIRSSIVKYKNSLYFTTKSGNLHKVNPDSMVLEGTCKLGLMATGTPSIADDVIYIGAANGNPFQDESTHQFVTVSCETMRIIDSVPSPGYPQAAPLVKDGPENNIVYFTYNKPPGGMKIFKTDNAGHIDKATYEDLHVPQGDAQEYSISPVMVDNDGTLYYKNDSGYIFALAAENAPEVQGLKNITLNGAKMEPGFDETITEYAVTLEKDKQTFEVSLDLAKEAKATIDGKPYTDKATVDLRGTENSKSVNIQVTVNGKSKTYVLKCSKTVSEPKAEFDKDGSNLNFKKGDSKPVVLRIINVVPEDLISVKVDNNLVAKDKEYTVKEGSFEIIFDKGYLERLKAGSHNVTVETSKGTITQAINISENAPEVQGLKNITLNGAKMEPGFDETITEYAVTLEKDKQTFEVSLDLAKEAKATIDGKPYTDKATVDLRGTENSKSVNIQVTVNGKSKTYVLKCSKTVSEPKAEFDKDGSNLNFKKGDSKPVVLRIINVVPEDLISVKVDNNLVAKDKEYTVKEGSFEIIFDKGYLERLKAGSHNVTVETSKGTITQAINISENGKNSDDEKTDLSKNGKTRDTKTTYKANKNIGQSGTVQTSDEGEVLMWALFLSILSICTVLVIMKGKNQR